MLKTQQAVEKVGVELRAGTNRALKTPKNSVFGARSVAKAGTKGVSQQADKLSVTVEEEGCSPKFVVLGIRLRSYAMGSAARDDLR